MDDGTDNEIEDGVAKCKVGMVESSKSYKHCQMIDERGGL